MLQVLSGLVPVILKNAETFSQAAAAVLSDQRAGDQIGTLMAGAYSLTSDGEISYDAALEFVRRFNSYHRVGVLHVC